VIVLVIDRRLANAIKITNKTSIIGVGNYNLTGEKMGWDGSIGSLLAAPRHAEFVSSMSHAIGLIS